MKKLISRMAVIAAMALAIGATTAEARGKDKAQAGNAAPQGTGKTVGGTPDMSKPVQVFILMGQSNMFGMGKVTGGEVPRRMPSRKRRNTPTS